MYEMMDALFDFGPYRVAVIAFDMFLRLWYFLVIGIVLAAAFNVFVPPARVRAIFHHAGGVRGILIAAVLGTLSPMGSYAVIPIFVALLEIGIPMAAVMTFLTASPLINPFMFAITLQMLGLKMALARTFSALLVGILVGLLFRYCERYPSFRSNPPIRAQATPQRARGVRNLVADGPSPDAEAGIERLSVMMTPERQVNKGRAFVVQCIKIAKHPGKWFAFSIILAAIVDVYVPNDWIVRSLGGHTYSLLLAAAMSIPFYVCGGGAVPLIWNLMSTGMDQGAALTFFVAGPVTRIAPMVTVIALLRYKAFALYIGVSLVGAIVLGFIYHYL